MRKNPSVGFLRPSERIAPLFARLGSLGESELACANSERINCVRNLCDLRSLSEPTKIRRRSQKLRPSPRRGGAISALGIGPVRGATLTGPTLRANLASRIAGLFARTDAKIRVSDFCPVRGAKIRALTREGRFSVPHG